MAHRKVVCVVVALVAVAAMLAPVSCRLLGPGRGRAKEAIEEWRPRIVTVRGVEEVANVSRYFAFLSVRSREGRPAALPVVDGDLLLCSLPGEKAEDIIFPYLAGDGEELILEMRDSRLLLKGKPVFLRLDEGGQEWARDASDEELAGLRLLAIKGEEPDASRRAVLEKLARINPNLGLLCEGSSQVLREALQLFNPRRLIAVGASFGKDDTKMISSQPSLEFLWLDGSDVESLEFLSKLPNLRRLVIQEWDPEQTGPFPRGCDALRSLTIYGSEAEDLSPIAHLTRLEELHVPLCKDLTDISAISRVVRAPLPVHHLVRKGHRSYRPAEVAETPVARPAGGDLAGAIRRCDSAASRFERAGAHRMRRRH